MSHYDPAHMPPPDPEAQAVLARKARRWLIGLALVALALAIWGVVSRRASDTDLTKMTLEAATPTVELVTSASLHRRAGADPAGQCGGVL